tara:strand:- start:982 stop:1851 length:870 start_codon:yes stop_codon:yes gene_type:complete
MINKNKHLISVIIPCFNSGKTITRTIKSLYDQTWTNMEIIVVNDGSDDQYTLEILKGFINVKIINQNNKGLSTARNIGAANSKGSFLLFLDADDWLEPNAIELMVSKLLLSNTKSFIFSDIKLEGQSQKIISKEYNFFEQLFLNQIPYCILISKKDWIEVGGYDENMKLGYEDWEFNIRLGINGFNGIRLKLPLFHYLTNNKGMLISKSSKYHAKIWKYISNKHKGFYKPFILIKLWLKWRKKSSTYPLLIFFIWFALLKLLPEKLITILFIFFRNIKWFFVRRKLFIK